ncbi:MAG: hypothetical protein KAS23_12790 [Anaerohalosphaera sp.]|nr:hypothetical protein [Anaerohalosphaera sp.]
MMSTNHNISYEYQDIKKFREGARYCKMDLHTHSPASECCDFTLPDKFEAKFPDNQKSTVKSREECFQFLKQIAEGIKPNPFKEIYDNYMRKDRPFLTKPQKIDGGYLKRIAAVWMDDIYCLSSSGTDEFNSKLKKKRDDLVKYAFSDLRRYLKSLFFSDEYVLRCYIEGLQLVALTDHNHPGYIVPRLPELGTWFSSLQTVNKTYVESLQGSEVSQGKVLEAIQNRLLLAKKNLAKEEKRLKGIKKESKSLNVVLARKEHVKELIEYWNRPESVLRALFLIPGTEITVSNVHLLTLYPPEWCIPGRIGGILRTIGIPEEQWGRAFIAAASASVQDTISLVDNAGGIAIPAHSNSDFKGLLRLFKDGLALTKVLEHPALLALEIKTGSVLKGKNSCESLKWMFRKNLGVDCPKLLCFVKGSDAHECRLEREGNGEDLGKRFTYVKMDIRRNDTKQEIFRSLRLALLCGQSRIIEWPVEDGYNYTAEKKNYCIPKEERRELLDCAERRPTLIGLTVHGNGCYADDLKVRFNPYLNCIIGSGGKSTLVRLVGYAFGAQSFMSGSKEKWLPELVRLYWHQDDNDYCIERKGKSVDPNAPHVKVRCLKRYPNDTWKPCNDFGSSDLRNLVEIWPHPDVQDKNKTLTNFEEDVIKELKQKLQVQSINNAAPLLINQPFDIFNTEQIFNEVLSKPHLKTRQIIWSTGSPNVATALDAEKIIVTGEERKGKHMKLIYGGDLHEDEICKEYLDHFEGGWAAFVRRFTLYSK